MEDINPLLQAIETRVCPRCGGSGEYSYCTMYGSRCFKCGGKKNVYTARGLTAHKYLVELRSRAAREIIAGDVIRAEVGMNPNTGFGTLKFVKVLEARFERQEEQSYTLSSSGDKVFRDPNIILKTEELTWHIAPDDLVRVAQTAEQKVATLKRALEFQATLTKKGTPRK